MPYLKSYYRHIQKTVAFTDIHTPWMMLPGDFLAPGKWMETPQESE